MTSASEARECELVKQADLLAEAALSRTAEKAVIITVGPTGQQQIKFVNMSIAEAIGCCQISVMTLMSGCRPQT